MFLQFHAQEDITLLITCAEKSTLTAENGINKPEDVSLVLMVMIFIMDSVLLLINVELDNGKTETKNVKMFQAYVETSTHPQENALLAATQTTT